ncbi:ribosomal protein S18-alanine N-acetyltransferase [Oricola indica]|jgi:ribosomal-protein-alanine N-acetyltransferase|uniref:ribosomal protein S18-alanine N-acetyltransferase n=1 Tax=Oricola indica TaxID=2872591 RepID=UPI001CBC6806|nr:ribosomal protein S18-alanine N-acetyltransferase [Oricola indica]
MRWPFLGRLWPIDVVVDPLDISHTRHMADLHAVSFSRPWTDGEFHDMLGQPTVFGFVARELTWGKSKVLGFVLARGAAGEAEILTITVAPDWQGHGLGRKLMDAVLRKAHGERIESVFLEVDETNAPAIALYRKLGFFQVGGRPDYYRDKAGRRTAALVMRRDLR